MGLRKVLLHVMLCSLAIAAGFGAMGILVSKNDAVWRIIATMVITGVAAALMLPLAMFADRERARTVGVAGMLLVVVEYILGLMLIWELLPTYPRYRAEEQMAVTMLYIAMTGIPALLFLRLLHEPVARVAAKAGLVLAGMVFILLMAGTWIEPLRLDRTLIAIIGQLALLGLPTIGCLAGVGVNRRYWRDAGIIAAAAAWIIGSFAAWYRVEDELQWLVVPVASVAWLVALTNILTLMSLRPGQQWLRYAIFLAAACAAVCLDLAITTGGRGQWGDLYRVAGAAGMLAGCGILALLVLVRMNRRMERKPVLAAIQQYTLICPGCESKHTLPAGTATCPTCGMIVHARFEEPRCPQCDYLLFMLKSDRCPECGAEVRRAVQPATPDSAATA